MSRFEPNLRIPGPTALPPSVREAGGRQMVNHRGDEFKALLLRVSEGMKPYFGTSADVIMLTCAGTGGLEAAVVNTLSPGDPVLAVTIGSFGDRFAKIAEVYGAAVTRLDVEWGEAASPLDVRRAAAGIPGIKAVLLTHNETSRRSRLRRATRPRTRSSWSTRSRPSVRCRSRWTPGASTSS